VSEPLAGVMGHSGGQVAWARHQLMPLCMHGLSQIAKTMVFMVIPFLEEVAVVFGIVKEMTFTVRVSTVNEVFSKL